MDEIDLITRRAAKAGLNVDDFEIASALGVTDVLASLDHITEQKELEQYLHHGSSYVRRKAALRLIKLYERGYQFQPLLDVFKADKEDADVMFFALERLDELFLARAEAAESEDELCDLHEDTLPGCAARTLVNRKLDELLLPQIAEMTDLSRLCDFCEFHQGDQYESECFIAAGRRLAELIDAALPDCEDLDALSHLFINSVYADEPLNQRIRKKYRAKTLAAIEKAETFTECSALFEHAEWFSELYVLLLERALSLATTRDECREIYGKSESESPQRLNAARRIVEVARATRKKKS